MEAKGARVVSLATAVAVEEDGNAERLYLLACLPAVLMKRRTVALMVLCVVYHLPDFACRIRAAG